jgi:hypothetical protein
MKGILVDVNLRGQMERVRLALESPRWNEFWVHIGVELLTFEDVALPDTAPDDEVWRLCQQSDWVLITGNRNAEQDTSLEATIQRENTVTCLPVFTIASPDDIMTSTEYTERVTEQLLDYLLDIEGLRGAGRLYLP